MNYKGLNEFIIIVFFLFFTSCGTLINPVYNKLSNKNKVKYLPDLATTKNKHPKVLIIDKNILENLILISQKKYFLIVMYAIWCKPCVSEMPSLLQYYANTKKLQIYFVSSDDWININRIKQYWQERDFFEDTFIIDLYRYGHVNHLMLGEKKRFIGFVNDICLNCKDIGGYPSFILLDKHKNILFKHTGAINNFNKVFNKYMK